MPIKSLLGGVLPQTGSDEPLSLYFYFDVWAVIINCFWSWSDSLRPSWRWHISVQCDLFHFKLIIFKMVIIIEWSISCSGISRRKMFKRFWHLWEFIGFCYFHLISLQTETCKLQKNEQSLNLFYRILQAKLSTKHLLTK